MPNKTRRNRVTAHHESFMRDLAELLDKHLGNPQLDPLDIAELMIVSVEKLAKTAMRSERKTVANTH